MHKDQSNQYFIDFANCVNNFNPDYRILSLHLVEDFRRVTVSLHWLCECMCLVYMCRLPHEHCQLLFSFFFNQRLWLFDGFSPFALNRDTTSIPKNKTFDDVGPTYGKTRPMTAAVALSSCKHWTLSYTFTQTASKYHVWRCMLPYHFL